MKTQPLTPTAEFHYKYRETRKFGRRWAYRRCREILAEPLQDIVFPSEAAAMKSFNEEWARPSCFATSSSGLNVCRN
jgi:hypothetical protein